MKANWIKPSEWLPTYHEDVLLYMRDPGHEREIFMLGYRDKASNSWFNDTNNNLEAYGCDIIAWTHLPEPPKL